MQELLVLCHMLSGDLDGCAVRQLLLLAELVEMIPWNTLKEFSSFASIVYPSLQVSTQHTSPSSAKSSHTSFKQLCLS